jgi:gluconolactonase
LPTTSAGKNASLLATGAKIKKIADGFKFTEDPGAYARGDVYFSDIPNAHIHHWSVTDQKPTTFTDESGNS